MPSLDVKFMAAYDEYAEALYRHIFFRVHNEEIAQDLLSEAFARVWQYVRAGNRIDNMKAFLYRTAHNLIIDHYRSKKEESLEALSEEGFDPSDVKLSESAVANAEVSHLVDALKKIPQSYGAVVAMRYIDELSPEEIGEILGESANTISVRIHRGVAMVRKLLHLQSS